jgi:hypothetical protein
MHQLILLTAMTATSGLFGQGGCNTGWCGRPMMMSWCAPRTACAPCSTYTVGGHWQGYACGGTYATAAPVAAAVAAPPMAPAAAPQAAPAVAPVTPPPPPTKQTPPAAMVPPAPQYSAPAYGQPIVQAAYYYPSYYGYPAYQSCPSGNCPRR